MPAIADFAQRAQGLIIDVAHVPIIHISDDRNHFMPLHMRVCNLRLLCTYANDRPFLTS